MGMYDPLIEPASTLVPGKVTGNTIVTNKVELNNDILTDISHDYTDSGITQVPSSKALYEAINLLKKYISDVDPDNKLQIDTTVITLPLLPATFSISDDRWDYKNWYLSDEMMIHSGNSYENYIKINTGDLTYPGKYFFAIDVATLNSGYLTIKDTKNEEIFRITSSGKQYFEVDVTNTDVQTFTIAAEEVFRSELVKLRGIGIYRVTDRLIDYLSYFVDHYEGSAPSREEVQKLVDDFAELFREEIIIITGGIATELDMHRIEPNPHGTTYEHVGAAPKVHGHTPSECGAAPEIHTHQPEECGAAPAIHYHNQYAEKTSVDSLISTVNSNINTVDSKLDTHIADNDNPHGTTYEQVGAAPKEHYHSIYISRDEVEEYVSEEVKEAIVSASGELADHATNMYNPHNTTYLQVGAAAEEHTHTPEQVGAAPSFHTHGEYVAYNDLDSVFLEYSNTASIRPMTAIQYKLGQLPDGVSNNLLTKPITPVIFPYILHRTNSNYDYYDGVCRSNRKCIEDHPLWYCFKKNITEEDFSISTCAFENTVELPVLLEYEFHTTRKLTGFRILPNFITAGMNGYISNYKLYINGKLHHASAITSYGAYDYSFDSILDVDIFSLRVLTINKNNSTHFGCKIEFEFGDVPDNSIVLKKGLSYICTSGKTELEDDLVVYSAPDANDSIKYLYVQENSNRNENNDSTHELIVDRSPYEYNFYREGLGVLLGKYDNSSTNTSWGTVESNGTSTSLVNTIYKDNDASYVVNSNTVTITHTFNDPQTLSGFKLVFFKELLDRNAIPDNISLVATTTEDIYNEELEMTETVVSDKEVYSIEGYIPYLLEDDSSAIWLVPKTDTFIGVTKLTLTLSVDSPKSLVGISKFIPLLSTNFFNILTNTSDSELSPFLLSTLKYIESYDGSFTGYEYSGIVIGTNVIIPIDGLDSQNDSEKIHTYTIPNPYHSTLIECSLLMYDGGTYTYAFQLEDISITNETITVRIIPTGKYCLHIKRIW